MTAWMRLGAGVIATALSISARVSYADEADELLRAERVGYCFDWAKFARDRACMTLPASTPPALASDFEKRCTAETLKFKRLQSFVVGSLIRHPESSGWTTNVAMAQASGRTDLAMCQKEIDESLPAVDACVGGSRDYDRFSQCTAQTPAPECKRLADRCAKIDDELPF